MWNRQEMVNRIRECQSQGVPITNYGLVIAYSLGILERALQPFPEALAAYQGAREEQLELLAMRALSAADEKALSLVN
jgi:hypothetical protein